MSVARSCLDSERARLNIPLGTLRHFGGQFPYARWRNQGNQLVVGPAFSSTNRPLSEDRQMEKQMNRNNTELNCTVWGTMQHLVTLAFRHCVQIIFLLPIPVSMEAKLSFVEPGRIWAHSSSPSKAPGISYQGTLKTSLLMLKNSGGL